jgi:hypothetical protein
MQRRAWAIFCLANTKKPLLKDRRTMPPTVAMALRISSPKDPAPPQNPSAPSDQQRQSQSAAPAAAAPAAAAPAAAAPAAETALDVFARAFARYEDQEAKLKQVERGLPADTAAKLRKQNEAELAKAQEVLDADLQ